MKFTGFTLLEVLIAIVILSFISVFTAQSLRKSLQHKSRIQKDIDQFAEIRNALKLMERDIGLAFHYRGAAWEAVAAIQQAQNAQSSAPTPTPPINPNQPIPPQQVAPTPTLPPYPKPTQFLGGENSLSFATLNGFRTMRDSKVSDQAMVAYELKSCPGKAELAKGQDPEKGQCLFRRTSTFIGTDYTKGGVESVLLENVQEFRLKYFGAGRTEWVNTWSTDEKGDALSKSIFPVAVEITLTTLRNKKSVSSSTVANIRFSNNPSESETSTSGGGSVTPSPKP